MDLERLLWVGITEYKEKYGLKPVHIRELLFSDDEFTALITGKSFKYSPSQRATILARASRLMRDDDDDEE